MSDAPALVTDAPAPESTKPGPPEPIRIPIRPEQADLITRQHQEMEAVIARVRTEFIRGLELLSAGQVPKGAAFAGLEQAEDGSPVLLFSAPAA